MTEHEIRKVEVEAFVYSRETPTDEQLKKVQDFLEKKYNAAVAVIPKQDDSVRDGFRIEIGTSTYKWNLDRIFDWSAEGRAKQLKQSISEAIRGKQDVLPMIRQAIEDFEPVPKDEEVGTVLTVGDGIATISGLEDAEYGEILLFECGIKGMILDLKEDEIGCVIFGDESEITEGSMVRRTKKVAGIPVGEAFMGRVINALGEPVDGKGPITQEDYYPIENPAPGIIDRQPANRPMETGLLSIDSMFPIGRGQRELIIGDRQTGHYPQPEGQGSSLHLRCYRSEGVLRGAARREPPQARRDGLHDNRKRNRQRLRNASVHRTLLRLRNGRVLHEPRQGRPDSLRRPFQARGSLPYAESPAGALPGT